MHSLPHTTTSNTTATTASQPMSLNFLPFEAFSWLTSIIMLGYAISFGRATWVMGVAMVAAYLVISFGFFVHNDEDLGSE